MQEIYSYVVYQVLTTLCLVTGGVIAWILVRVLRLTKLQQEPAFVIMLVCLQLALVASVAFFQIQAARLINDSTNLNRSYYCSEATIVYLSPLFLAYAAILNTNKWIYFNWHIVKVNQQNNYSSQIKRYTTVLGIVTGFFAGLVTILYLIYMTKGCSNKYR